MTGFIVMAQRKDSEVPSGMPMSYGKPNEPQPGYLLLRDRATRFKTLQDAQAALNSTVKEANRLKHPWPGIYQFSFLECEDA